MKKIFQKNHVFLLAAIGIFLCLSSFLSVERAEAKEYLDIDVVPEHYDPTVYDKALTTVYMEMKQESSTQELLFLFDVDDVGELSVQKDEENGEVTYIFPHTYNAIGNRTESFEEDSYVNSISIVTSNTDIVVTVSYKSKYLFQNSQEEDSVLASFAEVGDYSIRIKLPENVSQSQISDIDYYYKNTFIIKIPGNWKDFYKEFPITTHASVISSVKTSESGSYTLVTVKTKKLQGYKITEESGYLLVHVGNPREIYSNIVVLDAGHGGKDHGAKHNGVSEKNINYKIMVTLAQKYFNAPESNVKAYWSRHDDTFVSLSDRAKFASKVGADFFVSLHMNSSVNRSANGMEVYYSPDNNPMTSTGLTSQILAKRMHNKLNTELSIPSRGVKRAGFYVMKHNTVPAILVELGFLSGTRDFSKITSSGYQDEAARCIYECVSQTFKQYPTAR